MCRCLITGMARSSSRNGALWRPCLQMSFSSSSRAKASGATVFPLRPGDIVAAPAGTESHQIINTGDGELRYLGISTLGSVDVVDYPDSGKVAVAAGIKNADFSMATFRGMGRIQPADYFDDEA
jgi:hypothetical protein